MKTQARFYYLLLILASLVAILSLAPHNAAADGGGWPTPTPTSTLIPAVIVIQPGKDVLSATATPTNVGSAPLPDAPTSGDQLLPGLPAAESTNAALLPATPSSGNNLRFFLTAGILLAVILIVGFIVFRLRA